jgi:flagella basal body P-ring formation protein FlgA
MNYSPGMFVCAVACALAAPSLFGGDSAESRSHDSEIVLTLLDQVEVSGDSIRLRDLVAGGSASPSLDVPMGLAPALGRELVFTRADLDLRIRQAHSKRKWSWVGATECVIIRPAVEITEVDIMQSIESKLREFTAKEGQIRVIKLLGFGSLTVPKNNALTEVELVSPNTASRFGAASVSIQVDGRPTVRRNLRFEWEWRKPVWVAQAAVKSGRIPLEYFVPEDRDVLTLHGEPLGLDVDLKELALTRPLARGDVLLSTTVKTPFAITSGSNVIANVRSGSLLVSMKAVALENGIVGQSIRVQNPISRKEIIGRITAERTVEVTP